MAPCCHRCPNRPFGCFPKCRFPTASWASNETATPPPQWVLDYERMQDILAKQLADKSRRLTPSNHEPLHE